MTDQNRVNSILQALFSSTLGASVTPSGTGGGSGVSSTPPFHLRLLTAWTAPGNTSAGTEANGTNCPGYTPGSVSSNSLGTTFCAPPSGGQMANSNSVTWNATGTWTTINGIEIWDAAGTPLRWLQGPVNSAISGVVNGDAVSFAASAITVNASAW